MHRYILPVKPTGQVQVMSRPNKITQKPLFWQMFWLAAHGATEGTVVVPNILTVVLAVVAEVCPPFWLISQ